MGRSISWINATVLTTLMACGSLGAQVRVGADRLLEEPYVEWIENSRIGLITNQTGVTSSLEPLPDLLETDPRVRLVRLFAPEHGIDGQLQDGAAVEDGPRVLSLYPEGLTRDRLAGLDILIYDVQDVGVRFYTFISTLLDAMRAAADAGVALIVLDRPNPLGGVRIEGPVLQPDFTSFVGAHTLPIRYGLTAGELARLYRAELKIDVDLKVVPMQGWTRNMRFEATGLEWIAPSPNMPTLVTAEVYGGMAWIEGTNLSEGRGTTRPFQLVGAPWLAATELVRRLNARNLEGVRWRVQSFTPMFSKYAGQLCRGVQLHVTDRDRFSATLAALSLLVEIQRLHPQQLEYRESHFDRLVGSSLVRQQLRAGLEATAIQQTWEAELAEFRRRCNPFKLYPGGE